MECPFCKTALNSGAAACPNCGATKVVGRDPGRVMLVGCVAPIAVTLIAGYFLLMPVMIQGGRAQDAPGGTLLFLIMVSAFALGWILAFRVGKKAVWIKSVG